MEGTILRLSPSNPGLYTIPSPLSVIIIVNMMSYHHDYVTLYGWASSNHANTLKEFS